MNTKHATLIYWSNADNYFIAEVPELAGCMADGKTHIEAVKMQKQLLMNGQKQQKNQVEIFLFQKENWFMLD